MAIEVRIPTILRTYTDGQKAVEGKGETLSDLLDDLDGRHPGLRGRLVTEDGGLHRFVNVYVNDEDVRFLGGLETALADGDSVSVLPAVAGGQLAFRLAAGVRRAHPARRTPALVAVARRTPLGEARDRQPDGIREGPGGSVHGRGRREGRAAAARGHGARADVGQHRHLAGDGLQAAGIPADLCHAGEHVRGAASAA